MGRSVPYPVKGLGGNDNKAGKANVLMQVGGGGWGLGGRKAAAKV